MNGGLYAAEQNGASKYNLVSKNGPHDYIHSIHFDGGKGIAVGNHGLVMTTTNSGLAWNKLSNKEFKESLFSAVIKNGKCIAVGQVGFIAKSDDCAAWKVIKPITTERLLSVSVNSKGQAIAVGGFGVMLISNNWGESWEPVNSPWRNFQNLSADPHLYKAHITDDGVITVAGEFEVIARSNDLGKSWKLIHSGARSLFGMYVYQNGDLVAVGQEGLIANFKSGKWTESKTNTAALLTDVWATPDGKNIYVAGMRAALSSGDYGQSFAQEKERAIVSNSFTSIGGLVDEKNQKKIYVSGIAGLIFSIKERE